MTDAELTKIIREGVNEVAQGDIGTLEIVANQFQKIGIVEDVHVGKQNLTPREVLEWYAGQLISINKNKSYFAVNSFINVLDKFAPEL